MADIQPIVMPKWGLAMQEGMLAAWHVEPGVVIAKGQEIADIETSKIANVFESPVSGLLRRRVAAEGDTLPVGALLAVVADPSVADADLDAYVAAFEERLKAELAARATEKGPEPATVEAGGRRIRYLEIGAGGTPVLLVHGFGGDLNNWMFNQPALGERRRTLALDLPGHGGSTKEVGAGDVAALQAATLDLMDALGVDKAHLVGHSLGGAISLALALDRPDRVASATLVCPAGLGPDISMEYIDGFLATGRARKLRPILEMLVADPKIVTSEMVEDVLKMKRLDGVEAALGKIAAACFAGGRQALQLTPRLGELRVPVQVIWGEADRIIPPGHADRLPGTIKVTRLAHAGHLAHMERSAEVNALIEELAGT